MKELNDKQKEAINYIDGPCLVLAGAGSGKTLVLTQRIANLINKGISPYNILAITFTNKAAREMRERIKNDIGELSDQIFIGTFHSFGLKIIRENYKLLGYESNITIIDREDMNSIIKRIIKDMNLNPEQFQIRYIIDKISIAKNEGLSPEEYSKFMKNFIDKTIIKIYSKYINTLKNNNSLDFDDLLTLPLKLFKENKEILKKYQERFKYILVDEYQDTNQVQYDLCKILANKYKNIFVVGDIDQSIYSWRGANYKNVLYFENDYKNCKTILLEENYRSTQNILNAANDVIKHNIKRKEKKLWSSKDEGEKILYLRCEDEKDEAKRIINEVRKLIKENIPYSEIGILYRINAQSRVIEEEFLKENIPFKVIGSYYFYNRKEIKDLIAYLNLIYNIKDNISLERIINVPKRKIGEKSIQNLKEKSNLNNISMFESLSSDNELKFKETILSLIEDSKNMGLVDLIESVLKKSGMRNEYEMQNNLEGNMRIENLEEFKSIALNFEKNDIYSLSEFLEKISLVSDMGQYSKVENAVNLMTLHSAKGLEFEYVFITGMEENLFPHFMSLDDEEEIEEERRLCYVGITRAKKKLYLLNAKKRILFGNISSNSPSRFINEINESLLESNIKKEKKINYKEMYKKGRNDDITVGSKVNHEIFGKGIVIQIDKDLATIAFENNVGIKKIQKNHKNLMKL